MKIAITFIKSDKNWYRAQLECAEFRNDIFEKAFENIDP